MTDFEIMQYMSSQNMDIRMSPNFVETKTVKQGGLVIMGVDAKTVMDIFTDTVQPVLYCFDKKTFFDFKNGIVPFPKSDLQIALDETRELLLEVTRNLGHPAYEHSSSTHEAIDSLRERAFDFLGIPKSNLE